MYRAHNVIAPDNVLGKTFVAWHSPLTKYIYEVPLEQGKKKIV